MCNHYTSASRGRFSAKVFRTLLIFILLLAAMTGDSQQLITQPMTGTPAAGNYYNPSSITVKPNFSFTAQPGQSLHLYVSGAPDCQVLGTSPSNSQNYVVTYVPRIAGMTDPANPNHTTCEVTATIQYSDGLGRPAQAIQVKGSANGNDLVQPTVYDQYDREVIKYLPYTINASSPGSFRSNPITEQGSFYQTPDQGYMNTPTPYSQTVIEPSPLNRPLEEGAPGNDWQPVPNSNAGHTTKILYATNNAGSLTSGTGYWAKQYDVNSVYSYDGRQMHFLGNKLVDQGSYGINVLYVAILRNENWSPSQSNPKLNTTEEYKDLFGRVVLKRSYNYNPTSGQTETLSTYYVYDEYNNLTFVLPPAANPDAGNISQATLDNYCYQYRYDGRNRMTGKKIPGKGWDLMLYNQLDQVVGMQDSVQRMKSPQEWRFTKYDGQGRVIMTGVYQYNGTTGTDNRLTIQSSIDSQTSQWESRISSGNGYTDNTFPSTWSTVLTLEYYDDYNIPNLPYTNASSSNMTKGMLTASQTGILNSPNTLLWAAHYYDDKGRATTSYQQHYYNGVVNSYNYDLLASTYDFTNAVTTTSRKEYLTNSNNTGSTLAITIANQYLYDHNGRKIKTWEQLTNRSNNPDMRTLISQTSFNELGQVLNKQLHSTDSLNFLQTINYTYNERDWLLNSSAPLFSEQLQYQSNPLNVPSFKAQYNGNIASQYWKNQYYNSGNTYSYTYDNLNRLVSANSTDGFNENNILYDSNSNILGLRRYQANTLIDQLRYDYNSTNQLQLLTDSTTNNIGVKSGGSRYAYDGNGNVNSDASRQTGAIGIQYNMLDLPQTISGAKNISYIYDAAGRKLRRISSVTGTTEYIDGIEYDNTGSGTMLSFVQTEEGRAIPNGNSFNYEYWLTDHLGNNRVSFDQSDGGQVSKEQDDYYAFGSEISHQINSLQNYYLYNGKELQQELGQYDYGARFYDPVIGRWTSVDPAADMSQSTSPYAFCVNNPLLFRDEFGLDTGRVHHLSQVTITAQKIVKQTIDLTLYLTKPFPFPRYNLREPQRTDYAENFYQMAYNAIVTHSSKTVIKGQLLEKLKRDPAFQAWRKQIIALYKVNPQLKRFYKALKMGGEPFFSLNGDQEVKLSVRGAQLSASFHESNGSITIDYQINDTFDLDYQAGRGPVYNGINGTLKPIWMGVLDGRDDMKTQANWNETIER